MSTRSDQVIAMLITRVAVYRCSSCPEDRACALYPDGDVSAGARPRMAFGYSNPAECDHTWPRAVAEEMARRCNGEPGKTIEWEIGDGFIKVRR
jgi:hypothetical protein